VAETLRTLAKDPWRTKLTAEVVGVSTVQEEIGLRGARTSAYSAQPTVGIAIDVTHASDYPGVDKKRVGNVRLGHGPVLTRGANINPEVYRILLDVAQKQGIPLQFEAHGGGTGTDANAMQLNQAGMATGLVSIPLRYMHTPCEVASLSDIRRTIDLLVAFLCEIKGTTDFTPTMANLRPPHTGISPSLSKDEVDS
jgi:endoglucanase